jgi:predicted RND superfamily exporter protein
MLSLSSFRPLADFGVLTGIAMLTALAGDLFVLPATARLVNLWGKPKAP